MFESADKTYLDLAQDILDHGKQKSNRTGIDTVSVFGRQVRYDLSAGFPLLTTKKIHFHSVVGELLWFLKGDTNVKYLQDNKIRIWNEWANEEGELVNCYGKQWRRWEAGDQQIVDQIANVIQEIKTNPTSRRLIVSAWNPGDLKAASLPWCHAMIQFFVDENKLSCQLYQRSGDHFLGVPFNIASYALLTHMIAQVCGLQVGEFIHSFGDLHLYVNSIDAVKEQMTRVPFSSPTLWLNPDIKNIDDFDFKDIKVENYQAHPAIKVAVAV